jgi:hypothetical protein
MKILISTWSFKGSTSGQIYMPISLQHKLFWLSMEIQIAAS